MCDTTHGKPRTGGSTPITLVGLGGEGRACAYEGIPSGLDGPEHHRWAGRDFDQRCARRVLVAVAVVGALAVPAAAQARAVGTAASVSPLQAVTCTSGGNCWAVGGAYQTGAGFIEHWNGSAWQVVPSQNPPKSSSSVLDGVACAQVTSCWAVGYHVNARGSASLPYAEHWNGQAWSQLALPYPAHEVLRVNLLRAVSCPAANLCFADGGRLRPMGGGVYADTTLVERWNGSTWQVVPSPVLPHSTGTSLQGLSCASTRDCWATGDWVQGTVRGGALGYHWNGHQWAVARVTDVGYHHAGDLLAASCPTTQMCMGIGQKSTDHDLGLGMFAERWNGSSWLTAPPATGTGNSLLLYSVSCATAQTCMAVGEASAGATVKPTLVEQWNGSSWVTVPSPNPPGPGTGTFYGVSCPQVTNCWAVGAWDNTTGAVSVLIEHWNGTAWTIVPS